MRRVSLLVGDEFSRHIERAKADDDDVDVCLAARLARPRKGAVGKVDFEMEALEEKAPEHRHLLALRDGIRGDKCDTRGIRA